MQQQILCEHNTCKVIGAECVSVAAAAAAAAAEEHDPVAPPETSGPIMVTSTTGTQTWSPLAHKLTWSHTVIPIQQLV